MKAKTSRLILLLMFIIQTIATFTAEEFVEYENASVTPIHWTRDGTALILLGKERRKTGTFWCDFFGKKDNEDNNNPLVTAQREAIEESAYQLKLIGEPKHQYQGRRNRSTIHFIWEVDYVDPQIMRAYAENLRAQGKGHHIEKTDWKWVTLKDLLGEKTALNLHWTLKDKLKNRTIKPVFEQLCYERQRARAHHHRRKK